MSYRARVKRLERSIRSLGQVDPDNVAGALSFLWTGEEARIPAALNLAELQAAARMIRADKAAEALGLAKIGAALGEALGGDPLGHIAALRPAEAEKNFRVFWPDYPQRGSGKPTAGDELLARLGLCRLFCIRYQAKGGPAGAGMKS
jgi:hypothetical protein